MAPNSNVQGWRGVRHVTVQERGLLESGAGEIRKPKPEEERHGASGEDIHF
jgi:hypothetical protein